MPLIDVSEIRFVSFDGPIDERGYKVEDMTDPILVDHWRRRYEICEKHARDQITRCAELGHYGEAGFGFGGCGGKTSAGEWKCESHLRYMERDRWAPSRQRLVRIILPPLNVPG